VHRPFLEHKPERCAAAVAAVADAGASGVLVRCGMSVLGVPGRGRDGDLSPGIDWPAGLTGSRHQGASAAPEQVTRAPYCHKGCTLTT
jgi:hypothetical protein